MRDLESKSLIYFKAGLFLLLGCLAVGLILLEHPSWKLGSLMGLAIWSFCRCYYFAFYVIEKYVDSEYRFSGIGSFLKYWLTKRKRMKNEE